MWLARFLDCSVAGSSFCDDSFHRTKLHTTTLMQYLGGSFESAWHKCMYSFFCLTCTCSCGEFYWEWEWDSHSERRCCWIRKKAWCIKCSFLIVLMKASFPSPNFTSFCIDFRFHYSAIQSSIYSATIVNYIDKKNVNDNNIAHRTTFTIEDAVSAVFATDFHLCHL